MMDSSADSKSEPEVAVVAPAPKPKKKKKKNKKKKNWKSNQFGGGYLQPNEMTNAIPYVRRGVQKLVRDWAPVPQPEKEIPMTTRNRVLPSPVPDGKIVTQIQFNTVGQEVWGKKRCLKHPNEFLPIPRDFFRRPKWIAVEFRDRKHELNNTKNLLDNYPLDEWHRHTKRMNTAGLVMPTLRTEISPEYCSQAWCKMFECLSSYPLIPDRITKCATDPEGCKSPRFLSVHLCEAPGAFVSATNHFIHTNYPQIKWDWLATTLNPHYEGNDVGNMINEDKLILTSLNNWIFLEDTTGNIMNRANLDSLITQVANKCKAFDHNVDLVTADGSMDCQNNPLEQENAVIELQFAEIIAALSILGYGGTFVLKIFTFLECQTINHLFILCALFEEVHLFKPATSKEGNSEVYVICLKYKGSRIFQRQLDELKNQVGVEFPLLRRHSLISRTLVWLEPFIDRIYEAAQFFTGYQMAVIKRNIETFEDKNALSLTYYQHDIIRCDVSWNWLARFDVISLPRKNSLFQVRYHSRQITHVDPRVEIGTHQDKLMLNQSTDLLVKMREIERQLQFYDEFAHDDWIISYIWGFCTKLSPVMGRPFTEILSSRFCFGKILQLRHDLRNAVSQYKSLIRRNEFLTGSKKCNTCESSNIRFHFSRTLPDIIKSQDEWEFTCLCCTEPVSNILCYSDIKRTQKYFCQVLLEISELKIGQSLFLCTFPLLSRLQIGFVYVLTSIFKTVALASGGNVYNPSVYPQGILLHKYTGINSDHTKSLIFGLVDVVKNMDKVGNAGVLETILEIVPTKTLIEQRSFNDILKYNIVNTASDLKEIINQTKQVMPNDNNALKSTI